MAAPVRTLQYEIPGELVRVLTLADTKSPVLTEGQQRMAFQRGVRRRPKIVQYAPGGQPIRYQR